MRLWRVLLETVAQKTKVWADGVLARRDQVAAALPAASDVGEPGAVVTPFVSPWTDSDGDGGAGDDDGPPAHWLAYIAERAPHLVSGGRFVGRAADQGVGARDRVPARAQPPAVGQSAHGDSAPAGARSSRSTVASAALLAALPAPTRGAQGESAESPPGAALSQKIPTARASQVAGFALLSGRRWPRGTTTPTPLGAETVNRPSTLAGEGTSPTPSQQRASLPLAASLPSLPSWSPQPPRPSTAPPAAAMVGPHALDVNRPVAVPAVVSQPSPSLSPALAPVGRTLRWPSPASPDPGPTRSVVAARPVPALFPAPTPAQRASTRQPVAPTAPDGGAHAAGFAHRPASHADGGPPSPHRSRAAAAFPLAAEGDRAAGADQRHASVQWVMPEAPRPDRWPALPTRALELGANAPLVVAAAESERRRALAREQAGDA